MAAVHDTTIGQYAAYFFGGAFLMNVVPHLVAGIQGKPFQSPFAKPPGQGNSSSTVNVVWAGVNAAAAYALLVHVGRFDLRDVRHAATAFVGGFGLALHMAGHFGKFNGGNSPLTSKP